MSVTSDQLCMKVFYQSFTVNVFDILHGLGLVIDRMCNRERGHFVFMGSISAYFD